MDEIIKAGLTTFGISFVAIVSVAWLLKAVITSSLARDIEQTKIRLQADYAKAQEQMKAELSRQALEHEIKYRRVDQKVARCLDRSYRLLLKFYESVSRLVAILEYSGGPTKQELLERCEAANKEFGAYFYGNRCYVPPALYSHIKKVADDLVGVANDFARGMREESRGGYFNRVDFWGKAFGTVQDEISPLFKIMVAAVQKRLGVEDSQMELAELAKVPVKPIPKIESQPVADVEGEQVDDDYEDEFDTDARASQPTPAIAIETKKPQGN